jgi:hypothetical protein
MVFISPASGNHVTRVLSLVFWAAIFLICSIQIVSILVWKHLLMKKQKLDNRLELRIPSRMLDFLKRRAKMEGSSVSHIVREIIRRVIDD